jgi:hypothetical protein
MNSAQQGLASRKGERIICWFSCGAASAVATKIALDVFGVDHPVLPVYCDTSKSEHPDNERFISDCERWFNAPVTRIKHPDFSTVEEVFESKRYMSGIAGACCTAALKKLPRYEFQTKDDIHVFGFTADESKRLKDFELRNFELKLLWILRDHSVTKQDCYVRLQQAGIELPAMYKLGYRNNNCIGCVKATSPGYWSKIREDFPEKFKERAKQSREIGCRLVRVDGKRVFLDELPKRAFPYKRENLSCGPECTRK